MFDSAAGITTSVEGVELAHCSAVYVELLLFRDRLLRLLLLLLLLLRPLLLLVCDPEELFDDDGLLDNDADADA